MVSGFGLRIILLFKKLDKLTLFPFKKSTLTWEEVSVLLGYPVASSKMLKILGKIFFSSVSQADKF